MNYSIWMAETVFIDLDTMFVSLRLSGNGEGITNGKQSKFLKNCGNGVLPLNPAISGGFTPNGGSALGVPNNFGLSTDYRVSLVHGWRFWIRFAKSRRHSRQSPGFTKNIYNENFVEWKNIFKKYDFFFCSCFRTMCIPHLFEWGTL